MTTPKILIVEDNIDFVDSSQRYLSRKVNAIFAPDYAGVNGACLHLVYHDEKWRNQNLDGAIIDCFFPPSAARDNTEFAKRALDKILASDPVAQRIEKFDEYLSDLQPDYKPFKNFVRYLGSIAKQNPENCPVAKQISRTGRVDHETLKLMAQNYSGVVCHVPDSFRDEFNVLRYHAKKHPEYQPLGILVAEGCKSRNIPFILTTGCDRNSPSQTPITKYCEAKAWTLVDCPQGFPGKDSSEFWQRAYDALLKEMEK